MPPRTVKNIERLFKKILNLPFILFLKKGNPARVPLNPDNVRSVLILRPDKLGDMIATIPVIHALKKMFPHLRIEILASPRNVSVIKNDPCVDRIHLYSKNIFRDWPVMMQLRKKRFDVIYDPICHDSITGLLLTKIIGNHSVKAASRKLKLREYYDYCEPYLVDGDDHNIDNGLLIFNALGVRSESVDPFHTVHIPDESRTVAERFYQSLSSGGRFRVGLNISAGSSTRTLSVDKYINIANAINTGHPEFEFVIISVMDQRKEAERLVSGIRAKGHLVPENLSLLDISAIVSGLHLLISPDTSLVHIARLMRIPVVGLYSGHKRNFRFWRPYRQKHGAVVAKSIYDIHDIEPSQVVEEFELLLTGMTPKDSSVVD
ncbi:MAG: glycosyltransferase family 9 protein [Candidatus Zixiibacteriota bacterium]|nr:MAG: glycosyltransferase family 9 protein [candidate division Zixibacteria bacterium]